MISNPKTLKEGAKLLVIADIDDAELGFIPAGTTFIHRGNPVPYLHQLGPDYSNPINTQPDGGSIGIDVPEGDDIWRSMVMVVRGDA